MTLTFVMVLTRDSSAFLTGRQRVLCGKTGQRKKVFVSWLGNNLLSISNVELPTLNTAKPVLMAAAGNGKGEVAYILVGEDIPKDKDTPNWCKGVKVGSNGKLIVSVDYDTGAKNDGLNIYKFGTSGASLAWNVDRNELGLMMTRTQTRSVDGITHQGAIVVVLDGANMKILKYL